MQRTWHGRDPNRVLQQRIIPESSEEDSSCNEEDEEFNEMKVRNTYDDIRRYIMLRYDTWSKFRILCKFDEGIRCKIVINMYIVHAVNSAYLRKIYATLMSGHHNSMFPTQSPKMYTKQPRGNGHLFYNTKISSLGYVILWTCRTMKNANYLTLNITTLWAGGLTRKEESQAWDGGWQRCQVACQGCQGSQGWAGGHRWPGEDMEGAAMSIRMCICKSTYFHSWLN